MLVDCQRSLINTIDFAHIMFENVFFKVIEIMPK